MMVNRGWKYLAIAMWALAAWEFVCALRWQHIARDQGGGQW